MSIGASSSFPRRFLFRIFASRYFRRLGRTTDGSFEAFVSPGSSLRFLDPRRPLVEDVHARFIRQWMKPSDVVWDIGANLGVFAFPAALRARAGRVYAFEPDVDLAHYLLRATRLPANNCLPVSIICAAISEADGTAILEISKFSRAMNRIAGFGAWNSVAIDETRTVPQFKIDTLVKTLLPPDIIKIDVEGAELAVLGGGATTIAAHRPIILIEGPDELSRQMAEFFAEHRYVMLDGEAEYAPPLRFPVWNTVAIPVEKKT
jgi:FkbM family methyltransferase